MGGGINADISIPDGVDGKIGVGGEGERGDEGVLAEATIASSTRRRPG